ncbi:MAG: hypothetical protein ACK44B_07445 [Flavobacteriales bacterium]|jgi:hypothetical protein
MKTISTSVFFVLFTFFSISQIYEVEFGNHFGFNSGKQTSYEEIIKEENMLYKEFNPSRINKYVFDLDNKEINLFYDGIFVGKEKILSVRTKGELLFFTISDEEALTNKKIESHIVINQNEENKSYPRFTLYFISTVDGTSNGFLAF